MEVCAIFADCAILKIFLAEKFIEWSNFKKVRRRRGRIRGTTVEFQEGSKGFNLIKKY